MKIKVVNLDYHRNGVAGEPFHAVVFRDTGPDASVKLGVVFDRIGHVAVFDIAKLADCDVECVSNAWRGDYYEPALRRAVEKS